MRLLIIEKPKAIPCYHLVEQKVDAGSRHNQEGAGRLFPEYPERMLPLCLQDGTDADGQYAQDPRHTGQSGQQPKKTRAQTLIFPAMVEAKHAYQQE